MAHQVLTGVGRFSGTAAVELDVSLYCEKKKRHAEMAPLVLFDPENVQIGPPEDCRICTEDLRSVFKNEHCHRADVVTCTLYRVCSD